MTPKIIPDIAPKLNPIHKDNWIYLQTPFLLGSTSQRANSLIVMAADYKLMLPLIADITGITDASKSLFYIKD